MKIWKSISINIQNIKVETNKAVLFSCPNNSFYKGYSFWHPSKLVKPGEHSFAVKLIYNDDFIFRFKKYDKKDKVVDEIEVDVEEFEDIFRNMNDSIFSTEEEHYLIVKEPEKIELEEVQIPDCLQNR